MKRLRMSSAILGLVGFAALVLVASTPAKAAFVVGGENGWQMSFDGMINAFMVYSITDRAPTGNVEGGALTIGQSESERQLFRVRTAIKELLHDDLAARVEAFEPVIRALD